MVMPPALTQHRGIRHPFLIIVAGQAPRYRGPNSHFESDQKATIAGTI
jgi:hypothetical protein